MSLACESTFVPIRVDSRLSNCHQLWLGPFWEKSGLAITAGIEPKKTWGPLRASPPCSSPDGAQPAARNQPAHVDERLGRGLGNTVIRIPQELDESVYDALG